MTNAYNGVVSNIERALGGLNRHDTEQVLADLKEPVTPESLMRKLLNGNGTIREWNETASGYEDVLSDDEIAAEASQEHLIENPVEHHEEKKDEKSEQERLGKAKDLNLKMVGTIFSRENRTGFLTRVGGSAMTGLMDLWVQQDDFSGDKLRHAHVVEFDMINMEGVMMAMEQMLDAIDEKNKGKSRQRTNTFRMTEGYIRVVSGLVQEAFRDELKAAGIADHETHIHPVRMSTGDEFRLVVIGLSDEQIDHAKKVAEEKVQAFVSKIGLDALPHLKHMGKNDSWEELVKQVDLPERNDPAYEAFKYGGAGVKIASVALGQDKTTAELEQEIDKDMHDGKEKRAKMRAQAMDSTAAESEYGRKAFNEAHANTMGTLGKTSIYDYKNFAIMMKVLKDDLYAGYYRRPKPTKPIEPLKLSEERENAYPKHNPEEYIDEFIAAIEPYIELESSIKRTLKTQLKVAWNESQSDHGDAVAVADTFISTLEKVINTRHEPAIELEILTAKEQLENKRDTIREALINRANRFNPYESYDLTRQRIVDKKARRLKLTADQRETLFYSPLSLINARHTEGYCMSGRIRDAVKMFQVHDQDVRQYSYIGLSSFAGTNAVSTSLGRRINDNIRSISADELKKRFGNKSLDFAFSVESGRMNLLTHGINRDDLIDALSAIEVRVDKEINQQPLENLLKKYRIFTENSQTRELVSYHDHDRAMGDLHDELNAAQEQYGYDVPLVFKYEQNGTVSARKMTGEEIEQHQEEISAEKVIFIDQPSREVTLTIPEHAETYLKECGYVNDAGELDLTKPLAILPNAKHTQETGIRVVTAYVELLGNSQQLADQRRKELYRMVEHKKRHMYEPGTGYDLDLPIGLEPNLGDSQEQKTEVHEIAESKTPAEIELDRRVDTNKSISRARQSVIRDTEEWLRTLDWEEFRLLRRKNVPDTLLKMVVDDSIDVKFHGSGPESGYEILVNRQGRPYDREQVDVPHRRASFIKQALEEHFSKDVVTVTGLAANASGTRPIRMFVRPKGAPAKGSYDPAAIAANSPEQGELIRFFDNLTANKNKQDVDRNLETSFMDEWLEKSEKYRHQHRVLSILRANPDAVVERASNRKTYTINLPQKEGERRSVWRARYDALARDLNRLFDDIEVEEPPQVARTGGQSEKSRVKYEIRIKVTEPKHKDILNYMMDFQQHNLLQSRAIG